MQGGTVIILEYHTHNFASNLRNPIILFAIYYTRQELQFDYNLIVL